jgi:hypothetical protein
MVEDYDRSISCESENSRFFQISATEPQAEADFLQFSQ